MGAGKLVIRRGAVVAVLGFNPLQQRITFEFLFDIGNQIEIGQLQELDRLHQLRRHDQRLALPEFEFREKRHGHQSEGKVGPSLACHLLRTRCGSAVKD